MAKSIVPNNLPLRTEDGFLCKGKESIYIIVKLITERGIKWDYAKSTADRVNSIYAYCVYKKWRNAVYYCKDNNKVEIAKWENQLNKKLMDNFLKTGIRTSETTSIKPPLGVVPRFIHIEKRIDEITAAIRRSLDQQIANPIPVVWIEEYNDLVKDLTRISK